MSYRFSKRSLERLNTCHPLLVQLMQAVMATQQMDFVVLCGERTTAEQQALYAQGRTKPGRKVTNIDGVTKRSMHNYSPSLAVDIAPYPIDWNDLGRFKALGALVKQVAADLQIPIEWGGDWRRFKDYPHFQLSEKYQYA